MYVSTKQANIDFKVSLKYDIVVKFEAVICNILIGDQVFYELELEEEDYSAVCLLQMLLKQKRTVKIR